MTDRFLIWLSGVGEDAKRRIINFLVFDKDHYQRSHESEIFKRLA